MTDAPKNVLAINNAVAAAPFLASDPKASPFVPSSWSTMINYAVEHDQIDATNFTSWSKAELLIPKDNFFVGKIRFEVDLAALSTTGTWSSFHDGIGAFMIDNVKVKYGSVTLFTLKGKEIYEHFYKNTLIAEEREIFDLDAKNNLPLGTRILRATASQTVSIDLPLWWTRLPQTYLCAAQFASDFIVQVNFNTLASITQSDGTVSGGAMTNAQFFVNKYYIEDAVMAQQVLIRQTGSGVTQRFLDYHRHEDVAITAGVTSFTYELQNHPLSLVETILTVFYTADRTTNYANDFKNYYPVDTLQMTSGSSTIFKNTPGQYILRYFGAPAHDNKDVSEPIYRLPWGFQPDSVTRVTGQLTLANATKPQIKMTFASATPAGLYVSVVSRISNTIQYVGGQIKVNWTP